MGKIVVVDWNLISFGFLAENRPILVKVSKSHKISEKTEKSFL
jgi:hypothetical protein